MPITIRFEATSGSRTLSAAIRREPDGAYWDFAGSSWGASITTTPLTPSPSGAIHVYSASSPAAITADGVYSVLIREAGATVATRYATLIDGDDGAPGLPAERSSDLADVLLAVRERLVERGVFTDATAEIALADDVEAYPDDGATFCRVCCFDPRADDMEVGGGRAQVVLQVPILIRIAQRKAYDRPFVARRALTNPDGILRKARAVMDALTQFIPTDAAACPIVCEPLRLASPSRPVRYSGDETWFRADIQFSTSHRVRFACDDFLL